MQELVQHRTGRTLNTIPFFAGLAEHKLNLLGGLFVFQQVKAGACVFQEGERSRKFYVIARGKPCPLHSGRTCGNCISNTTRIGFFNPRTKIERKRG